MMIFQLQNPGRWLKSILSCSLCLSSPFCPLYLTFLPPLRSSSAFSSINKRYLKDHVPDQYKILMTKCKGTTKAQLTRIQSKLGVCIAGQQERRRREERRRRGGGEEKERRRSREGEEEEKREVQTWIYILYLFTKLGGDSRVPERISFDSRHERRGPYYCPLWISIHTIFSFCDVLLFDYIRDIGNHCRRSTNCERIVSQESSVCFTFHFLFLYSFILYLTCNNRYH